MCKCLYVPRRRQAILQKCTGSRVDLHTQRQTRLMEQVRCANPSRTHIMSFYFGAKHGENESLISTQDKHKQMLALVVAGVLKS